jgi:hypothetical protein
VTDLQVFQFATVLPTMALSSFDVKVNVGPHTATRS